MSVSLGTRARRSILVLYHMGIPEDTKRCRGSSIAREAMCRSERRAAQSKNGAMIPKSAMRARPAASHVPTADATSTPCAIVMIN